MIICIDSSVYISSLGDEDIYSDFSRKFFHSLTSEQIIIPALVVAEVINILNKQKTGNLKKVYDSLLSFRLISFDHLLLKYLWENFPKKVELKSSDLVIAITAQMTKATLITWDGKLLSSASSICPVTTPRDYIKF